MLLNGSAVAVNPVPSTRDRQRSRRVSNSSAAWAGTVWPSTNAAPVAAVVEVRKARRDNGIGGLRLENVGKRIPTIERRP
ncbi:hypothetical protein GCM10010411_82730 [Actinomadura fulvescens]|uniref:Uncharacterized protein n=1 Tax=Actinomadura fulvescens TaxID=46160 RepID=A0ABP6CZL3_9ACTN